MEKNRALILAALLLAPIPLVFNSCDVPDTTGLWRLHGTGTGNPMSVLATNKILVSACDVIRKGHPQLSQSQCSDGVLNTSFSDSLGVPPQMLNPYRNLATADQAGAVNAASQSLTDCLSAINGLDPNSQQVQQAYDSASFDPFSGVKGMIPQGSSGCPLVFADNNFAQPTPTPPPPGVTVVGFDNPTPLGLPFTIFTGLFQGIDFGNQWDWALPYNADSTNSIYIDQRGNNSATFSFSGGPKILNSISVFSPSQGGTLIISDDTGQSITQFIPSDLNMHVVNTGFAGPSSVITISFSVLYGIGIDDITFRNPANAPPVYFVQGRDGLVTAPSNSQAFLSNTTAGNLIVVQADWSTGFNVNGVSDSQGNTYYPALPAGITPIGNKQQIWYAKDIKGGSDTITVDYVDNGNPNYNALFIYEYGGADPLNPVDVTASASGTGVAIDSGAFTTHFPDEIIFAGILLDTGQADPGAGFTRRTLDTDNFSEDRIVASAGTFKATALRQSSNQGWSCQVITFRAAP